MIQESAGVLTIDISPNGRITLLRDGVPIIVINPQDWIIQRVGRLRVRHQIAWHRFREQQVTRWRVRSGVVLGGNSIHLLGENGQPLVVVGISTGPQGVVSLQAIARSAEVNRLGFYWWAPLSERLYGFGEYGNGPVRRFGHWSTWAEEGPVGIGPLSPWLRWTGRVPIPKGYNSTYAPLPSWLSSGGYGGWVDNTERIDWSVRGARRMLRVWGASLKLQVATGTTLKNVIKKRTEVLGHPPLVPPWVLFPWIDAVRGQAQVLATAAMVRREKIPASAVWVEDWMGSWEDSRRFWMRPLTHEISRELYPDIGGMAESLHRQGFKLLGYFCPEIAYGTALYEEARDQGHLVLDGTGMPVDINILGNHHGEPDLTRKETREWIQRRWLTPLESVGFDGWMADFGEYLPVQSVLSDGSTGLDTHNRYPLLWHSLHREFWDKTRPDGDYTFFVRSASLGSASIAPVMWGGDSDTDWDKADGLATVVPQALSAGVSGHALWGTDISGYMTFGLTRPSTKELYIRWLELAALLPIMRTHHGTARPRNWHWSRDQETLAIFARYARLHAVLFPYFYSLMVESHETGLPLVRPMFLEFSECDLDRVNTQFLLGDSLLVAPVVIPQSRRQRVRFPSGGWWDWWSATCHDGPSMDYVAAELDRLPLFLREGHMLPLMDGLPDEHYITPGFSETLVDVVNPVEHLSILLAGRPSRPHSFRVPGGALHAQPTAGFPLESPSYLPAPPPADVRHVPLLARPGLMLTLQPRVPSLMENVEWLWEGSKPLTITVRPVDSRL